MSLIQKLTTTTVAAPRMLLKAFLKVICFILWLVWEYFGRLLFEKIFPNWWNPNNKYIKSIDPYIPLWSGPKPATITFWLIGIYIATWGVVSQRYENALDRVENRYNAILVVLSSAQYKEAFHLFGDLSLSEIPFKPEFDKPLTLIYSFFKTEEDLFIKHDIKGVVEIYKSKLNNTHLSGVDLSFSTLKKANLQWADLEGTQFNTCNLNGANLDHAFVIAANFKYALMSNTKLNNLNTNFDYFLKRKFVGGGGSRTSFESAKLGNSTVTNSNLSYTVFDDAYFYKAKILNNTMGNSSFYKTKLFNTDIISNNFNSANFKEAKLEKSYFINNDFSSTNMEGASLKGSSFYKSNFKNSTITSDQLCEACFLLNSQFDQEIAHEIQIKCPDKLEAPDFPFQCN